MWPAFKVASLILVAEIKLTSGLDHIDIMIMTVLETARNNCSSLLQHPIRYNPSSFSRDLEALLYPY
jgi:hypothetical protein